MQVLFKLQQFLVSKLRGWIVQRRSNTMLVEQLDTFIGTNKVKEVLRRSLWCLLVVVWHLDEVVVWISEIKRSDRPPQLHSSKCAKCTIWFSVQESVMSVNSNLHTGKLLITLATHQLNFWDFGTWTLADGGWWFLLLCQIYCNTHYKWNHH